MMVLESMSQMMIESMFQRLSLSLTRFHGPLDYVTLFSKFDAALGSVT